MSSLPITTTTNASIVPEIWSARFFDVLRSELPFLDSVDFSYSGEIAALGDTINISTIEDFDVAGELAEGAAGDSEVPTVSGQQLVVNKLVYKDFIVTKQAQLQSLPFMDKLRDKAAYSINKKIQELIIAAISPSTSSPDHVISYDSGTTLALSDILEVQELLNAQDVPFEMRVGTVGSAQYSDLFNITGFVSRDFIPAGSPLSGGMISSPVCGFNIKMTTALSTTSYWHHPSFFGVAIQEALNVGVYDMGAEGYRSSRVNSHILMGIKQLSNIRVVSLA